MPEKRLVPERVTIESAPPAEPPISVSKRLLITRNSRIESCEMRARARPRAGSVKSTPSTMIVACEALPPAPITGPPPMKR